MIKTYLKRKIERYSIVSFDIFDTLIERDVQIPTDIFKIVAEKYFLTENEKEEFWKIRVWAEHEARKQRTDSEVNLDEIYEFLRNKYGDSISGELKNLEIEEEWKACKLKKTMYSIYKYAIEKTQKVYLISDMYLPVEVIERLLNKCGISGYDKLYISNEYRANKVSGELFDIVCKENGLQKEDWLHIGDSYKADFKGARRMGVSSVLIYRRGQIKNKLCRFFKG